MHRSEIPHCLRPGHCLLPTIGVPLMSSTLPVLIFAAGLIAQHPAGGSPAAPGLSAEEVARLESAHLTNIRQVTSGFSRAGEGYFSPDGHSIIFQAVPYLAPTIFHHPKPDEDGYQIYTGTLEEDSPATMVSTGQGRCTCPFFHPMASRSCLPRPI